MTHEKTSSSHVMEKFDHMRANLNNLIINYGGGVNSVAMILHMHERGEVPRAIVMSDPGSEWPETIDYRDNIMRPWLASKGWPDITVVSRISEAFYRPRVKVRLTLYDDCVRKGLLPSIAYFKKSCSGKWKQEPARWWAERQEWCQEAWARGERIVKCIGYDADEPSRIRDKFNTTDENRKYMPRYPLYEAKIGRLGCEMLIERHGLSIPHKSACTFCASAEYEEWMELRDKHPELFAAAVAMSRGSVARTTTPDVVGLMSCNEQGKRQLHEWVDAGFPDWSRGGTDPVAPCECST